MPRSRTLGFWTFWIYWCGIQASSLFLTSKTVFVFPERKDFKILRVAFRSRNRNVPVRKQLRRMKSDVLECFSYERLIFVARVVKTFLVEHKKLYHSHSHTFVTKILSLSLFFTPKMVFVIPEWKALEILRSLSKTSQSRNDSEEWRAMFEYVFLAKDQFSSREPTRPFR